MFIHKLTTNNAIFVSVFSFHLHLRCVSITLLHKDLFSYGPQIYTTIIRQGCIVVIQSLLPQALPLKLFWSLLLCHYPFQICLCYHPGPNTTIFFSKSINLSYQVCTFSLGISIDRNEEGSQSSLL